MGARGRNRLLNDGSHGHGDLMRISSGLGLRWSWLTLLMVWPAWTHHGGHSITSRSRLIELAALDEILNGSINLCSLLGGFSVGIAIWTNLRTVWQTQCHPLFATTS
jgi:hypothetical protein